MALFTWAFYSYPLVTNHQVDFLMGLKLAKRVPFNNRSLRQDQQRPSLICPFPVLLVFSSCRQTNEIWAQTVH